MSRVMSIFQKLLVVLALLPWSGFGEGIRELRPDSATSSADLCFYNTGLYTQFGLINCPVNYRLYIHVKSPGEQILFGLRSPFSNIQYNLKKPDGTIVLTGTCPYVTGQTGFIRYYHQAVVGPFVSLGGYTPLTYTVTNPADTGDYYFEITNLIAGLPMKVDLWDFQVVSGAHTPAIPSDMIMGRVWSQSWQFNAELMFYRLFNGRFYVYADDGIVTKLVFDDARIGVATIFCNPFGCLNTGNFLNDRKSNTYNTYVTFPGIADYKVFLNDPDSTVYPSGFYGTILSPPLMIPDTSFPPCSGHMLILVNVNKPGNVMVTLTFPYGSPATNVDLYAAVNPGINSIPWNGLDGLGNAVPDGTPITGTVTYLNGLTNLPIWDQEQNMNGYSITLVRPVNPSGSVPMTYWDDSGIPPGWSCPTGTNLTGCMPSAIGCHTWSGDDCHDNMINTWWYGGSSTMAFNAVFAASPMAPAGHDHSRCGPGTVLLHATVSPTQTVDWYAQPAGGVPLVTGDTSFTTPVLYNTTVYFAEARSEVTGCFSSSRTPVTATILPIPIPSLSGPDSACAGSTGNLYLTDPGNVNYLWTVSAGGSVTAGQGTYAVLVTWTQPGAQSVSVNYTDTGGCEGAAPTSLRVAVIPVPDSAGPISGPPEVCSGATGIVYSVSPILHTQIYSWTVPSGVTIVSGAGTPEITVNFSQNALSGHFRVHGSNACGDGAPSPLFPVDVIPSPEASAGPGDTVCQGTAFTVTGATASGFTSLHWVTSGQGVLLNDTTLSPTYIPVEWETGPVTLTLVAGNVACPDDSSRMTLWIGAKAVVFAGDDRIGCQTDPVWLSEASATQFESLHWETSGSGIFDDPGLLHPVYTPSVQDLTAGIVFLLLTATPFPPCPPGTDTLALHLIQPAEGSAGPDDFLCGGSAYLLDAASALNYSSLLWTTAGSGTFSDPAALHPTYTPGLTDIEKGFVVLTLTLSSQEPCATLADSMQLTISRAPGASAGPDTVICSGVNFQITAASAINYSSLFWTHNGAGILTGETTLHPVYYPDPYETGDVSLTMHARGIAGCADSLATDGMILQIRIPLLVWAGPPPTVPKGTVLILYSNVGQGSGKYSYHWEPAGFLSDPDIERPVTVPLLSDIVFTLHVTDLVTGCQGSDSVKVTVGNSPDPECLVIHNVITPNGDGVNDTWIIDCIELYPENTVNILNRWGDEIRRYDGYNNSMVVWDGTNRNGEVVPDGTYYYVLTIRDQDPKTGWIFVRGGNR